ncbi:MAG: helix-turn-helix domain-containing protein [Opitutaceae bacterium]|nr:helix-turn-helix domain-containing protein [Opitutaceae bacterium]
MHHACGRLLDRERSITEVAMMLGYADAAHFSHMFQAQLGCSPREFRRKYAVQPAEE